MMRELSGLFYKDEIAGGGRPCGPSLCPEGRRVIDVYNELRLAMLQRKGIDLSGLTDDQLLDGDDCYYFPNVVGPIYPGSTTLFRVRPNGLDPGSTIKDLWTLEWPAEGEVREMCERKFYPDWSAKDWGLVTNQDYANVGHVHAGMKSAVCKGLKFNPRQESNVLHMHRVIDEYLLR